MRLQELGEYGLIQRIRNRVVSRKRGAKGIIVGMGDDAFVARLSRLLVVTKDLLIEDIHFRKEWASAWQIGYKSMAVNLSDLAAMGRCRPRYGFVGLGLPGTTAVDYVDKLYTGMNKIGDKYGVRIVGGDTVSSRKYIVISITLVGEAEQRYLLTRSCAKPGDLICVTGTFGDSGGGLYLLRKGIRRRTGYAGYLIRKQLLPEPRLHESSILSGTGKVTSMIDSSDGLAASVGSIADASGVRAHIHLDRIPLSRPLQELAAQDRKVDPLHLALSGGEDYELVFTVNPRAVTLFRRLLPNVSVVGEMVPGRGVRYYRHGREKKINARAYEHFAR